jgi:hypothetical protein
VGAAWLSWRWCACGPLSRCWGVHMRLQEKPQDVHQIRLLLLFDLWMQSRLSSLSTSCEFKWMWSWLSVNCRHG